MTKLTDDFQSVVARCNAVWLATLWIATVPTGPLVNGEDVPQLAQTLLQSRKEINSIEATATLERLRPQKIHLELYFAWDGKSLRLDQVKKDFSLDPTDIGHATRRSLVEGSVRSHSSVSGAKLDEKQRSTDFFVDLRLVALDTKPLLNLDSDEMSLSETIVHEVVQQVDAVKKQKINGIECHVLNRRIDADTTKACFFEVATGNYRGCRRQDANGRATTCWIEDFIEGAQARFPKTIRLSRENSDGVFWEERVSFSDLRINGEVPKETFTFSGLGVPPGTQVSVSRGNTAAPATMFWNGTELVSEHVSVYEDDWGMRTIIGMGLIILATVSMGLYIKRNVSGSMQPSER